MNKMNEVLPIVLYVLGSILLVVLIILGIKLIVVMDKVNAIVDNINSKVESLNGLFAMVETTTDKLSLISNRLTGGVMDLIKKVFKKKKEEEYEDE